MHCYAEKTAARFHGPGQPYEGLVDSKGRWNGSVRVIEDHLGDPLRWRRPRRAFVNSMSDLFHASLTVEQIDRVFDVMQAASQHTFIVLTKRAERMSLYLRAERTRKRFEGIMGAPWPLPNVQIGVSVEDQRAAYERIPYLVRAPAAVRLLSVEPLLAPLDLAPWLERVDHCRTCGAQNAPQQDDRCPVCGAEGLIVSTWGHEQAADLRSGERYENGGPHPEDDGPQLHWVIVGGESGSGARPMHPDWARSIRDQCVAAGVAFHFKQWGGWREMTRADIEGPSRPGAVMLGRDGERIQLRDSFDPVRGDVFMMRAEKRHTGRELDGRVWNEFPPAL